MIQFSSAHFIVDKKPVVEQKLKHYEAEGNHPLVVMPPTDEFGYGLFIDGKDLITFVELFVGELQEKTVAKAAELIGVLLQHQIIDLTATVPAYFLHVKEQEEDADGNPFKIETTLDKADFKRAQQYISGIIIDSLFSPN